ncbi:MAG: N-acetylglucosamine-6-phosphate deacetylase [Candidatus Omnitrophica bacterium]|nr:N-acetylglucosamine-6-phosphate deacetylase [Candidatus Omnitrophota bacterium]
MAGGKLVTPRGIVDGAVRVARGRIAAIRPGAPQGARAIGVRGGYVSPGFIDLHVWGDPQVISREAAKHGTTAFLAAVGPEPLPALRRQLAALRHAEGFEGAQCLGAHLEGPFVNPRRSGALPRRWMRRPSVAGLHSLVREGPVRLITIAPELHGAREMIQWCRRRRIVVSLGHSEAYAPEALGAVEAGAAAVTHVFNGMRPFHHRKPSLLSVALTDPRLTTMVILDGVHVGAYAFRLLLRAKGPERIALVTDSIRHQGWNVVRRHGAYYTRQDVLAGSSLTMLRAVRNAVFSGGASLSDAVRMASATPARLLGADHLRGALAVGRRADLAVFDRRFRARLTIVGGHVVFESHP